MTLNEPTAKAPDHRALTGPFDIVGDVHGCADELVALLGRLGHGVVLKGAGSTRRAAIDGTSSRQIIFVGDFVDRGPCSPDVMRIVMTLAREGRALAVPGNHDDKFRRWLEGRQVKLSHGLERTVAQMSTETPGFHDEVRRFLGLLPHHLWLDRGRLVVAHAGIKEAMIGDVGGKTRSFCLYGDTDGVKDENGLSVRYHWAAHYGGTAAIVYGHTPVADVAWVNNTLCIDTGCCFGGRLTALQWPERRLVSVPAWAEYARPLRAFGHPPPREAPAGE
jgi:protein phosphatase